MVKRVILLVVTVFWASMMALLWRAEYGSGRSLGSPVPVGLVWGKILTAPDSSTLQIHYRGTNLGFCRWTAAVGQEVSTALSTGDELGPQGLPDKPATYKLDLEGSVNLAEFGSRVGYDLVLKLDGDQRWQEFHARLKLRPDVYEIEVLAPAQTVRVKSNAGGRAYDRLFKFSDLQNPQKLLREAGGPLLPAMLGSLGLPTSTNALARLTPGLKWTAHEDWLMAGRTRMRIYRLETRLLDRYRIRVSVSPVGEILRIELPGEVVLQHDTLGSFPSPS